MRQHVQARAQETRIEAMRQAKQSLIQSLISPSLLLEYEAVQAEAPLHQCAWNLVVDKGFFFLFRLGVQF